MDHIIICFRSHLGSSYLTRVELDASRLSAAKIYGIGVDKKIRLMSHKEMRRKAIRERMIDSSWESSAYAEMQEASSSEHKITKDKDDDPDKDTNENTARAVGCLSAAVDGCEATEQTPSTSTIKEVYDHMMIMRSHEEEKRENPCEELRCQSPKGLFTMVDHGRP